MGKWFLSFDVTFVVELSVTVTEGVLRHQDAKGQRSADRQLISGVSTQNVELDELYSFSGEMHPDEQESDLEEVGQYWTHVAMARESRLMLEVVVGPRTQQSATKLLVFAILIHFIKSRGPWPT